MNIIGQRDLKPCPFCGHEPMTGEFVPELIQRWNARAVATASIDKEVMAGTVQHVMEQIPNALRMLEDS